MSNCWNIPDMPHKSMSVVYKSLEQERITNSYISEQLKSLSVGF